MNMLNIVRDEKVICLAILTGELYLEARCKSVSEILNNYAIRRDEE